MKYKTTVNLKQPSKRSKRSRSKTKKKSSVKKLSRDQLRVNQLKRKTSKMSNGKGILRKAYVSQKSKERLKKIMMVVLLVFSVGIIFGGIFGLTYLQRISADLPNPEDPFKDKELASEILDRNGELLFKVFNEFNRDEVNIEEIPDMVKWAFLAAEDREFYDHPGFDISALIRCGVRNITAGEISCGGSTITQQTLKITSLYNERGYERKLKEILLALQVERLYDKDQILQMYLTVAPFGSNMYGVSTASNFYFGKNPSELTLAQGTILASIINDPVRFSPTLSSDPELADQKLDERANWILDQLSENRDYINEKAIQVSADREDESKRVTEPMVTDELIAEAREELASIAEDRNAYYREPVATDKKAGHFVNYTMELLQERNYKNGEEPFTTSDLQTGGYRIYTTLDYNLQQVAERYVEYGVDKYARWRGGYNAAVMTMTPGNGEVITMVGSRNFNGTRERCNDDGTCKFDPKVNVLNTLQSAGSSMKPLGYYIGYSEGTIFPGSMVPDIRIEWGSYKPKNVDNAFWGFNTSGGRISTAQNMLRHSRNLPALQVLESYGVGKYVETAQAFGYSTIRNDNTGQSVILGGTDIIPIEHVQAYGVFSNGGDFVEHEVVLRIEDRDGKEVFKHEPKKERVGDPQGIYVLNASTNNMYGDISWDGRNVSGKTGTTQGQKDLIMMLYSPDFVTMGWVGNSDNSAMTAWDSFGGTVVKPWLVEYMKDIGNASYFSNKTAFARPGGVISGGGPCKASDTDCEDAVGLKGDLMIQGKIPPADQEYHYLEVCDDQTDRLARQIDIDTGHATTRRFTIYKHFVPDLQSWLDRALGDNELPTEECNVNRNPSGNNEPWVNLDSPTDSAVISGGNIQISGNAFTSNANSNVTSVEFYLDNVLLGQTTEVPFDVSYPVPGNIDNGSYTFRAVVYDSAGQSGSRSFRVTVNSLVSGNLTVTNPTGTVNFEGVNPLSITAGYGGPGSIGQIEAFVSKDGGDFVSVGTFNIGGSLSWMPDHANGQYRIYLVANVNNTGRMQSNSITVNITAI